MNIGQLSDAQFPKETVTGVFKRQESIFRQWIEPGSKYEAAPDRYHLYISYACPWAHRTLITRALKELEDIISISSVDPVRDERGWRFSPKDGPYYDSLNGFSYLSEAYKITDPHYDMRVTVPVFWDKHTGQIMNNESADIIIMLNDDFNEFTDSTLDLYPSELRHEIDEINGLIYTHINNGVYKCGFATDQQVYEKEVENLFNALDRMNERLDKATYLVKNRLTLADIRLFVTLIRFDAVYYNHFKTNKKHIYEYEYLWKFVRKLYQNEKIKPTVRFEEIKDHYFKTHPHINPTRIVPSGPDIISWLDA